MKSRAEAVKDVAVLALTGRIGIAEMQRLRHSLNKMLGRGQKQVVVNLEYVPELSWSAIGALLEKSQEFKKRHGAFKIAGLNHALKSTFEALGAHQAIEIYDTEAEALESFKPARQ